MGSGSTRARMLDGGLPDSSVRFRRMNPKQQAVDARGVAQTARAAWRPALVAYEAVERLEAAWDRAHAALALFTTDGRVNDRGHAQTEITAALGDLTGLDWSK